MMTRPTTEQPHLFEVDPSTHARRDDPETSRDAARRLSDRSTMMRRLLLTYLRQDHTAEGAANAAGYDASAGAWKRVSDLRAMGYIEDTGRTWPASSGRFQMVCRITDAGRRAVGA